MLAMVPSPSTISSPSASPPFVGPVPSGGLSGSPLPSLLPSGMSSSSQAPTWVLILVAILTVVGTLAGVALGRILEARQAKERWKQEEQREELRWSRERADRREQWSREDRERWNMQRLGAYSELLVRAERWLDIATRERAKLELGERKISREAYDRLNEAAKEIENAQTAVELLAPESTRGPIRNLYVGARYFAIVSSDVTDSESAEEIRREAFKVYSDVTRELLKVRTLMRLDLGVEQEPEETGE